MRKKPPRGGVQLLISSSPFLHDCSIAVDRYGLLVYEHKLIRLVIHPIKIGGIEGIKLGHSMS